MNRMQMKLMFKRKKYHDIARIIKYDDSSLLSKMTDDEKEQMKEYGMKDLDHILLSCIFDELNKTSQEEALIFILIHFGFCPSYIEYIVKKHLDLFVHVITANKDVHVSPQVLIYTANIASEQENAKVIDELTEYFIQKRYFHYLIECINLKGFDQNLIEVYVFHEEYSYIKEYLRVANNPNYKEAFGYVFNQYFNLGTIKNFYMDFKDDINMYMQIYLYIKKHINILSLRGEYLLQMLEVNPEFKRDEIIHEILEINELSIVRKLMAMLGEKEQEKYGRLYLESKKEAQILTLAVTTDSTVTYELIDEVLIIDDKKTNMFIISELKGRFRDYALNFIVTSHEPTYILNLINEFFILGSICHIYIISFLIKYHYLTLFTKEIGLKLQQLLNEETLKLELKK